jgi:formylglycine-generating enzyme required for sulfatase activity
MQEPQRTSDQKLWEPDEIPLVEAYLAELAADDTTGAAAFAARHAKDEALLSRTRSLHGRLEEALAALAAPARPAPGQAGEPSPGAVPGAPPAEVPGFAFVRELGRGGMGVVYEARDLATARSVALKVIPVRDGHATAERYRREVAALARLRSPHVVTLYSSGAADGAFYYAMELLEGETFEKCIARFREQANVDRFARAADVIAQAAAGAEVIHAAGIVHRDLKPSNIYVAADGTVKLIDFGLVRVLGEETVTRTGAVLGSSAYMSPEQILRDAGPVDARTDVYALGVSLYEACALKLPFESRDGKLPARVVEEAWTPPSLAEPSIPRDLAAIIERATEFRADDRYQSAGALAADLRAFLAGAPVSARPLGRWGRAWRAVRRRRKALGLSAALVVLAFTLAFLIAGLQERSREEEMVRLAFETASRAASEYRSLTAVLPAARARAVEGMTLVSEKDSFAARRPLLDARDEAERLADRASSSFESALLAAQRGLEVRQDHEGLRSMVSGLAWERLLEIEGLGRAAEESRLRALIVSYSPEVSPKLQPRARVSIRSEPPGARVHLFRYEASGPLLLPVPYAPGKGLLLKIDELPPPRMVVVHEPHPALAALGLRRHDRIVSVEGAPTDSGGNRVLRRLREIDAPQLEIERAMERVTISLPQDLAGRPAWLILNDCVESDAFPLAFVPAAELGATPSAEIEIDAGSYLVVLRHQGCRDTRVPFQVRRDERREILVNLFTDAEIGDDMLHVPAGPAIIGGDPMAFSPEPERSVTLPDFFISRREVTVDEYFRFLNDPAIRAEIAATPGGESGSPLLPVNSEARGAPRLYNTVVDGTEARYAPTAAENVHRYVSRAAAERYVAWLNERESKRGGQKRFALPSADEIEKAARGADGRRFPWGNGFDLSLVASYRSAGGSEQRNLPFATDASPYDVRDLAGSISEWTRDDETLAFASPSSSSFLEARVKGGSYYDDLEPHFRLGGHTRERVREGSYRIGFRVVAYPPPRAPREDGSLLSIQAAPREAGVAYSDDPFSVPRWIADVDGDGCADYCRLKGAPPPEGDGLAIGCLLLKPGKGFDTEIEIRGVPLGNPGDRWIADVDGDRRADFCRLVVVRSGGSRACEIRCLLSQGSRFEGELRGSLPEPGIAPNRWFADVDGDRRADFCRLVEISTTAGRGREIRCLRSQGARFEGEISSGAIEPGLDGNRWLADVNGDGRADFCRLVPVLESGREGLGLRCLLSSGGGFSGEISTGGIEVGIEGARWMVDINADGRADYCHFRSESDPPQLGYLLATSQGFDSETQVRRLSGAGHGREGNRWWADANGDGRMDFLKVNAVRWSSRRFWLAVSCFITNKRGTGVEFSYSASE